MFLKVGVPVLVCSLVVMPVCAQTTLAQPTPPVVQADPKTSPQYMQPKVAQPISPVVQADPKASFLASMPDMGSILSSFLSSASTTKTPAMGDKPDVLIQRAEAAYKDKRFKDVMIALQMAQDALRRQHMDYYAGLLPQAHGDGWTLDEVKPEDTICFGEQMFGGGAALSRSYSNNGQRVKVTFVTDAPIMSFIVPLLQGFAPLLANGELAQGTVKGYPSIYFENKENDMQAELPASQQVVVKASPAKQPPMHILTVLTGDVIVNISSETLGKDFLGQFANIIDYERLKAGQ